MNRGVITISESGTVSMPTDTVWMTMQEIADMYNVFGCYVRKAVKAVFKDGILKEQGVAVMSGRTTASAMMCIVLNSSLRYPSVLTALRAEPFGSSSCSPSSAGRQAALNWSVSLQRTQWHRTAI